MMREAMRSTLVDFSSDRMVKQYAQNAYIPLSQS
jgi:glucan phosphorylase